MAFQLCLQKGKHVTKCFCFFFPTCTVLFLDWSTWCVLLSVFRWSGDSSYFLSMTCTVVLDIGLPEAQQLKECVWIWMNERTRICMYCSVIRKAPFSPSVCVLVWSLLVSLPSVEISGIKLAREQQVAQARRKATPVVGDMRPLADALPELSQLLPSFRAQRKNKA